jgi:hypothetical protein
MLGGCCVGVHVLQHVRVLVLCAYYMDTGCMLYVYEQYVYISRQVASWVYMPI